MTKKDTSRLYVKPSISRRAKAKAAVLGLTLQQYTETVLESDLQQTQVSFVVKCGQETDRSASKA